MKAANSPLFSSVSDQWRTPTELYDKLNDEFNFDFDPCPLSTIPSFDGLLVPWGSRTFCNPPYSNIAAWCKKAYEEANTGKIVVLLIPSRTDTKYWHEYIMKASEIRFCRGRLRFNGAKINAPFPSAVVIFNAEK